MLEDRNCIFCGRMVGRDGGYSTGKNKIKQWFHNDCFDKGAKRVDSRSNSDIYPDTMPRSERGDR